MCVYIYVLHVICLLATPGTYIYVCGGFFFLLFSAPATTPPPNYIGFYSRKNYEGFVIRVLFGCNSLNVWQWQWESWIRQIGGTLYWVSDVWTHFCLFFLCCILHISFFSKDFHQQQTVCFVHQLQTVWLIHPVWCVKKEWNIETSFSGISLECVSEFLEGL